MSADFPTANPLQSALGGSAVFRTTDGGGSWAGASAGLRTSGVRSFATDNASPLTVYAGTEFEGVFKSVDAGSTWTPTGREIAGTVASLAVEITRMQMEAADAEDVGEILEELQNLSPEELQQLLAEEAKAAGEGSGR